MDFENLFAFMFSDGLNLEKFVQVIRSLNYTEFDDISLKKIKERFEVLLKDLQPKLSIKKYNVLVMIYCLIFSGISSIMGFRLVYILLALLLLCRDVIVPIVAYFKDKKRYESDENIYVLKDIMSDIDAILKFRKNKETAIDLEEVKKNSREDDLNYINSLINFISSRMTEIPFEMAGSVSTSFGGVLNYFENNKDNESLDKVKTELERIADTIVECLEIKDSPVIDRDLGR